MKMSGRLLLIIVSCFAALAKAGNIAEELTAAGKDFWYALRNAVQKCSIRSNVMYNSQICSKASSIGPLKMQYRSV